MKNQKKDFSRSNFTISGFDVFEFCTKKILVEKDTHQSLFEKDWIPYCSLDDPNKIIYTKMSKI